MENIYKEALNLIEKGNDFCLATIITKDGSAPRGPGAKMIIRKDGSILGTIGGGLLEAVVMRRAGEIFMEKKAAIEEFHLKGNDFSSIDMTCGGDLKVLVDFIDSFDPLNLEVFKYLNNSADVDTPGFLITLIPGKEDDFAKQKHSIILDNKSCIGQCYFDISELSAVLEKAPIYKVVKLQDNTRLIVESLKTVYSGVIFGAGHVGRKVAELLKFIGFRVVVIDDREEFANSERFPFADRIHVVKEFNENIGFLNIDSHTYLIIVTRGHINDEIMLKFALRSKAGYVGMIGSKSKRDIIYKNIREQGFTDQDIARVHAPIGLSISAETPEEIALSIAAEVVKFRAESSK
ncbi:MAG: XdhC family protein [Spirochaetes bacterium]|nr:XdhC family protein [Spirochaetota bacterium]